MTFWSATRETERLRENETSHSPSQDSIPVSESDDDSQSVTTGSTVDNIEDCSPAAATKNEDMKEDVPSITSSDKPIESASETTQPAEALTSEDKVIHDTGTGEVISDSALPSHVNTQLIEGHLEVGELESESKTSPEWCVRLLTGEELVELLLTVSPVKDGGLTTVGMVRANQLQLQT